LKDKGFYVAGSSYSNYAWTFLSLPSSLNLRYLDELPGEMGVDSIDLRVPYQMIEDSALVRLLRSAGYKFIHFNSTWGATQSNRYADREIAYKKGLFRNEFLRVLSRTTLLKAADSLMLDDLAAAHLYTFEELPKIPELKVPTFAFVHFLVPHYPFLFDRNGKVRQHRTRLNQFTESEWALKDEYIEQLVFVTQKIQTAIDEILSKSEEAPIIVLQSDHGPTLESAADRPAKIEARMAILNAYHLPGGGEKLLYENISPVNSFRLILSYYFNADYPLLRDVSYFSKFGAPYRFEEVSPGGTTSNIPTLRTDPNTKQNFSHTTGDPS
jgi:hypothetical protein